MSSRSAASPQRPWPLPGWLRAPAPWVIDIVIVAVVGAAQISGAGVNHSGHGPVTGHRHLDALGIALLAVSALALAGRRQRPVPVLVVTAVVVMLYYLLGYPYGLSFLSLYVAFFTAVISGHRLAAWVGAVVVSANLWMSSLARPTIDSSVIAWTVACLLIVLVIGEVVRLRRAYLDSLRQRAIEAERTRDEEGRRRVSEERLHIARELHDLIGHNISLINVQASVGLHLLDRQPEQAAAALTAIKQASKDTLDELRLVIGAVRGAGEGSPRRPTRGLADLDPLVATAVAAGLDVRMEVVGTPRPVPAGLGLTAFRIVQESLTNVRRHAGPATAAVRLEYRDDELTVAVEDDGQGPAQPPRRGGNGLAGMRERAAAAGGQFEAGPRPGGGFRVTARLPLDPALEGLDSTLEGTA
ncbi:MAG TPA: sensor histidine kinase [Streptosporangiaceae bacterium]|jgi:signal transduction histidine kinase